jgi:hypothetical protein
VSNLVSVIVKAPTLTLAPASQTFTLPASGALTVTLGAVEATDTVVTVTTSSPPVAAVPVTITLTSGVTTASFSVIGAISGTAVITAQLPSSLGGGVSNAVTVSAKDQAIAGLTAANSGPTALGGTTALTATISTGTNVSYTWGFGDGGAASGLSTSNTISHAYPASVGAVYTAVVTATNSIGANVVATTVVTINNPKPVISSLSTSTLISNTTTPITITGTSFITGAQVQIQLKAGGPITTYTPSSVSSTQIAVTIQSSDIQNTGPYNLWVLNPSPPVSDLSDPDTLTVQ